jgi:anti-anti-sigma regulatory factor
MKTVTFKMKVTENKKDKITDLVLEGDLSLKNAGDIRKAIQSYKQFTSTVKLEIRNPEKFDITTIQTITAFRRLLANEGKTILIRTEFTPETERLLKNAGFDFSI